MSILTKQPFGTLENGEQVHLFHFKNSRGIEVSITDFGGRIVRIHTPDRAGQFRDIVLGFDDLDGYAGKNPYFGALVGRYANRIANGRFTLGDHTFELAINDPPNTLHGGFKGFDHVLWAAQEISTDSGPALQLTYISADGEEGFPGKLTATVTYRLTENNELRIDFLASADKSTVVNLTNHSYFDLAGQGEGAILDHMVTIYADRFTPVNEHLIPTGELQSVVGTPFDFRSAKRIGDSIDDKNEQLKLALGYDHNFVLNKPPSNTPELAARAVHSGSGRVLEVLTTQPGVQFYTGNHLDGTVIGKGGAVYGFRTGFCLETQHFPDSPNHPTFPSTEVKPGQERRETTIFRFSVEK